jgi:hypothetical protein
MGLVGNEGVLGVAAFLGGESTCSRALAAVAGDEFRLPAKLLEKEFAAVELFNICFCDTYRHSLPKFHKPLCATTHTKGKKANEAEVSKSSRCL